MVGTYKSSYVVELMVHWIQHADDWNIRIKSDSVAQKLELSKLLHFPLRCGSVAQWLDPIERYAWFPSSRIRSSVPVSPLYVAKVRKNYVHP